MNKPLVRIIAVPIFLLALIFIITLVYDNHLHEQEELRLPSRIGSYRETGYYKIDPETILASLQHGDANVFTLLQEAPEEIEALTNISISWTQADFLKIASALGQIVWGNPMNLKEWSIYYIYFEGSCQDNSIGFDFVKIAYFKPIGTKWMKVYTTRLIEIHPYYGWVRWGGGETYPQPVLRKWNGVDLFGAKITANDALRIANENGEARLKFENKCGIIISSPQNSDNTNWYLSFIRVPNYVNYIIDLNTGKYTIQTPNK